MTGEPVLAVANLSVSLVDGGPKVVDDITVDVGVGEVLGVVGESGSGKTTLALALLGTTRSGVCVTGGTVQIRGTDIVALDARAQRQMRGRVITYVPQDPAASLNPARRIGTYLREMLEVHRRELDQQAKAELLGRALADVDLPSDAEFLKRYPHELSGGQQQRVAIAGAFVTEPAVVVLDEPTTGLDVATQAHILTLVRRLCADYSAAAVFVSHDLEVIRSVCDRLIVMYGGQIMECGSLADVLSAPRHPYTRALMLAAPTIERATILNGIPSRAPTVWQRPTGCPFAPRCSYADQPCRDTQPPLAAGPADSSAACLHPQDDPLPDRLPRAPASAHKPAPVRGLSAADVTVSYGAQEILHGVSMTVRPGACVGLVGASGSGKTTLARALIGLVDPTSGEISLDGQLLERDVSRRSRDARRAIQYVFQNPYASLNPRKSVGQLLRQPVQMFDLGIDERALSDWLGRVALDPELIDRRPAELSGGERQRVAIARALICEPRYLICDEITSALDVSVQATIVELLAGLARQMNLGLLFVTHDLALVRSIADEIVVMNHGEIVEHGSTEDVMGQPASDYAQELLVAARNRSVPSKVEALRER